MSDGTQRRLAAIVSADVVGYSRLMGADETGTLAAMRAHRKELWNPTIGRFGGRIVGTAGDAILVEFASAVAAVESSIVVQQGMTERNAELPDDKRMLLRIGINIGEVVIDGDDIFGDGVNVAARLQEIAQPGGIAVSGNIHEQVEGKLDDTFADDGMQEVKNITRPVQVWRWSPAGLRQAESVFNDEPLPLPDKPSIAVLPFDNMSGDPEQEFFSDGIAEDIITGISRYRSLFVIARNSSFTYKGKAIDVKHVGRELGVQYVLEGSVRKAGSKVRVTAQLVDAFTGNHIWAERYDRELDDIFAVQDEVTQSIIAALPGQLEAAGLEQARRKPTEVLDAYENVLRGRDHHHRVTKDDNERALQFVELALKSDPNYSEAYAWRACTIGQAMLQGYREWTDELVDQSLKDAQHALELDDDDTEAHRIMCRVRLLYKQFDESEHHLQRALALNANDPRLVLQRGINLTWYGEPDDAITWIREAMRRDPYHESLYSFELGCALFVASHYGDAMTAFKKTGKPNIRHYLYMACCAAQLDDLEKARTCVNEVLKAKSDFSIEEYLQSLSYKNNSDLERHRAALVKAGLPE